MLGDLLVITKSLSQIKKIINSQNINDNLGSNEKYLSFKEQKSDNYSFLWIGNNNSIDSKNINDYYINFKQFDIHKKEKQCVCCLGRLTYRLHVKKRFAHIFTSDPIICGNIHHKHVVIV